MPKPRLTRQLAKPKVTKLNQKGAKLVADLSHARLAVYEAQRLSREQEAKLEQIPALERKLHGVEEKSAVRGRSDAAKQLRTTKPDCA
jgi:hypothetical protein